MRRYRGQSRMSKEKTIQKGTLTLPLQPTGERSNIVPHLDNLGKYTLYHAHQTPFSSRSVARASPTACLARSRCCATSAAFKGLRVALVSASSMARSSKRCVSKPLAMFSVMVGIWFFFHKRCCHTTGCLFGLLGAALT